MPQEILIITLPQLITAKKQCTELIRRASNDNQKKLLLIYKRLEREIEEIQCEEELISQIINKK